MVDLVAAAAGVLCGQCQSESSWSLSDLIQRDMENVRDGVSTTSDGLLAGPAVPDTGGMTLDSDLSAECAGVAGVLGDFHLLDLLTERGTVTVDPCQSSSRFRSDPLLGSS